MPDLDPAHPRPDDAPPARTRVALIAAVARDGAIGRGNELLWHEPADQRRFRALTTGAPVLMGRKTWDSLPDRFRPLPGRRNLVLTRQPAWHGDGAERVDSLAEALARAAGVPRLWVIGGAEVYRLALPRADELFLTEIDADLDGDTFFPAWERGEFDETAAEPRTDRHGTPYRFADYRRRPAAHVDDDQPGAEPLASPP